MRRFRGMTLAELMLALGLSSLLLLLAVRLLVTGFRLSAQGAVRGGMQNQAVQGLQHLETDLRLTTAPALTVQPSSLALTRLNGLTGLRTAIWETHLVIYGLRGEHLIRKTWPPAPPGVALTFDPGRPSLADPPLLAQLVSTNNGTERRLAQDVKAFSVTRQDGGMTVEVSLQLEAQAVAGENRERFALTRRIGLRNRS